MQRSQASLIRSAMRSLLRETAEVDMAESLVAPGLLWGLFPAL